MATFAQPLNKGECKGTGSYKIPVEEVKEQEAKQGNFWSDLLVEVRNIYGFLISDLDGDNCPFYPSCSHFFVRAVRQTNLLQGSLMFADRFTRDSNIFKDLSQYPVRVHGRLYDPVFLYTLDSTQIDIRKLMHPEDEN